MFEPLLNGIVLGCSLVALIETLKSRWLKLQQFLSELMVPSKQPSQASAGPRAGDRPHSYHSDLPSLECCSYKPKDDAIQKYYNEG